MIRMLAAALGAVFCCSVAWAHLHDRPDLTQWLRTLRNGANISCCDNNDAEPVQDPDWRVDTKGHYQVFHKGEWLEVPDSAVLHVPNRDGRTLLWMGFGSIRCFLPGAGV